METSSSRICIEELRLLEIKCSAITTEIDQMKRFLNDFSSAPIAREILEKKDALKKEMARLRSNVMYYQQNIKNRQDVIQCRVLVEQRKKKKRDFDNLVYSLVKPLTKTASTRAPIPEIRYRCFEQILEVAEFSIDSMVLSLQSQNYADALNKQLAEQRLEVIVAELHAHQQAYKQARQVIENRLRSHEAMLEETRESIRAWLSQDRAHLEWTLENDPVHRRDAITRYQRNFPDDPLAGLVSELPQTNQFTQPPRIREKTIKAPPREANKPHQQLQPWKLFLVFSEEDDGILMPNDAQEFGQKLKDVLQESCYQGLEAGIALEKIMLEVQRIDENCATSPRIVGHKFKNWIKVKVGLDYRMLILPNRNVRHLRFFIYPKKSHKQVLAQ